jgi:hypothetical protein
VTSSYRLQGSSPGQLANGEHSVTMSRIAAAAVPFGRGVCLRGEPADVPEQGGLPASAEDITARFRGISVYDEAHGSGGYTLHDPMRLVRKGVVLVEVEGAPDEGQAVYCRFIQGAGGNGLGVFRANADATGGSGSDPTAALVPRAVFCEAPPFPGRAWVRINLP